MKDGMAAFDLPAADLGKENDLADAKEILSMATEEVKEMPNLQRRQESIAEQKAKREHELKLAEIKRQQSEDRRLKAADEARQAAEEQ